MQNNLPAEIVSSSFGNSLTLWDGGISRSLLLLEPPPFERFFPFGGGFSCTFRGLLSSEAVGDLNLLNKLEDVEVDA